MAFAFARKWMTTETRLIAPLLAKSDERGRDGSDTTEGSAVRDPSGHAHEAQLSIPENSPDRKRGVLLMRVSKQLTLLNLSFR